MLPTLSMAYRSFSTLLVLALSLASVTQAHDESQNLPNYSCAGNRDHLALYTTGGVTFELRCVWGAYVGNIPNPPKTTLKQCADVCAAQEDPLCQGADWEPSSGTCYWKTIYFSGRPGANYFQWKAVTERVKRECPPARLTAASIDADVVDKPTCPDDNGKQFITNDGAYFSVSCCSVNNDNSEIPGTRSVTGSFDECAERCTNTKDCQSIVYSGGGSKAEKKGTCKLYTTGGFRDEACDTGTRDYAYISPGPPIESPDLETEMCSTECPGAHGGQYKAKGGKSFRMYCSKKHGTKLIRDATHKGFDGCMDACSLIPGCNSVDYHISSGLCFYGKHLGEPEIAATGFASAHSMGCDGACDKDTCAAGQGEDDDFSVITN